MFCSAQNAVPKKIRYRQFLVTSSFAKSKVYVGMVKYQQVMWVPKELLNRSWTADLRKPLEHYCMYIERRLCTNLELIP